MHMDSTPLILSPSLTSSSPSDNLFGQCFAPEGRLPPPTVLGDLNEVQLELLRLELTRLAEQVRDPLPSLPFHLLLFREMTGLILDLNVFSPTSNCRWPTIYSTIPSSARYCSLFLSLIIDWLRPVTLRISGRSFNWLKWDWRRNRNSLRTIRMRSGFFSSSSPCFVCPTRECVKRGECNHSPL